MPIVSRRTKLPSNAGTGLLELTRSRGYLILGKTPEEGAHSGSSAYLSRGVPTGTHSFVVLVDGQLHAGQTLSNRFNCLIAFLVGGEEI